MNGASWYLADFERHHQWPAEWKAVDALENGFCAPLQLDRLASDVACGRATLIRRFARTFGLSLRQYHTQLRVRHAVAHLRSPDSNIDSVARLVGYGSTKNLYRAFRNIAGLTPSAVREMAQEEVDVLLQLLAVSVHCRIDTAAGSRNDSECRTKYVAPTWGA